MNKPLVKGEIHMINLNDYDPYNWNASYLRYRIHKTLSNKNLMEQEIAESGQDNFRFYNVFDNPEPFFDRLQQILFYNLRASK